MSRRENLAYAITHAPRGQKGGPYEADRAAYGSGTPQLSAAARWTFRPVVALGLVRRSIPHARVIRIVRARPSEASAVEVLREVVAYPGNGGDLARIQANARRVLASSGPDPMPVVRAAMRETEAWDAYLAAPATRSRAETEVLDNASRKRFAAVDAYRKAGGK